MARADQAHEEILNTLRARIFRAPTGQDLVLHETEIAAEFGLSRTPIRQMFQALAAEHLLETRVGVGSVAPKLKPDARMADFEAYAQIALAAARLRGNQITSDTKLKLAGVAHLVSTSQDRDEAFMVDISLRAANTVADVIVNPIVAGAYKAARWQVVRWRVQDLRMDPQTFWDKTAAIFPRMAQAAQNDSPALMLEIAGGIILDLSTPLGQRA